MPILAEHVWSSVTDPQNSGEAENIGTGPYVFGEYSPGPVVPPGRQPRLRAWAPRPRPRSTWPSSPSRPPPSQSLRAGEVDMVAPDRRAPARRRVRGRRRGRRDQRPRLRLDHDEHQHRAIAPLDRPELRAAIADAIDPQALIDTVLLGTGTASEPRVPAPRWPDHRRSAHPHLRPGTAAAAALDELGAEPGDDGIRVLDGEPLAGSNPAAPAKPPNRERSVAIARHSAYLPPANK